MLTYLHRPGKLIGIPPDRTAAPCIEAKVSRHSIMVDAVDLAKGRPYCKDHLVARVEIPVGAP